ncbi:MAG: PKD domain-containing protein, partial [Bacteroidales bacterium]|nr:PKD domain-containing protein [Bacteroidales bacterium]
MKKLIPILLISILCLFSYDSLAQGAKSPTLLVDTGKLENFTYYYNKQNKIRLENRRSNYYPSNEDIRSMYFKNGSLNGKNGEIECERGFIKRKRVSYPVKNKEIFNKVLPGVDMLFEYAVYIMEDCETKSYQQRFFAKYNGKYYTCGSFNLLLEQLGLTEQFSVEEKIECVLNWRYWLFDQNIEILRIEQTKEQMPYDTVVYHLISPDSDERHASFVHNDYEAKYYGRIMLEGKEMEFYATVVGDKRFIKSIYLFEPGTKTIYQSNKNSKYNLGLYIEGYNYNTEGSSKNEFNYIRVYINDENTELTGTQQQHEEVNKYCVVYYYPANASEVILNIPHSYVEGFNKADIIVESVGSAENHSLYFEELDVYYPTGVRADITGLPSGMYRVRYRQNGTQNFLDMEYLYIIPESYAYYPLSATGQTLKSSYLSQMFGFNYSAANTHIGYIKSRMNEVCSKYINDGLIGANEFFDNDGTIEVFLVPPEADNQVFGGYPTYYRSYLESDAGASMIGYNNEDRTKFKFRANYQNFSLYNVYGNESNFIAYLAAHEVFHWITRSLVPLLRTTTSINGVDFEWLDEGLSTMSQAYCYPDLELQQNSSFENKCKHYITHSQEKFKGIFSQTYSTSISPYNRGLFFYYLTQQQGLGVDFIKGILTNFQTMQDVSNSNYEDKIKELFESANNQISNPSFSSSDEILASFSSEFIKKQFLGNLLNYENQDFYSMILGSGTEYLLLNYGGIANHKEVAPTDGQMHIDLQIQDENGQYGNFYCAVGVWDQNNNFVEGSFQEFYLNQELYEWYPVLDVNQGHKALAILLKLNEIEEQETVSYLLNMQFQEAGAPLTCDFCCNYEQINSQNENSVQIAPNNSVRYESICTGEGLSYYWNFEGGEPSVSNSANPQVYYSTPGEYNVSLQVINASNEECIDSREDYIMVWGYGFPVAAFGVNGSTIINPGDQVQFIDQSFNSAYVTWSFPNGEPNTSDEQNPVVTYYEPGIYNVSQQAHTPPESHGLTSWNYITVLNPNNLEINCIIEELVLPNEPVYSTAHLVAAPNNNTFYTYEFNFGDGFINEVTTNELWVSSDWHSYVQPGDYDFVLSVYNENNTMVSSCTKTIFVRDIFQPIDVNLVLEPANPALGEPFEITVESDA